MISKVHALIIDHRIVKHLIKCTESENKRVTGIDSNLSIDKFEAFIAILYGRGA